MCGKPWSDLMLALGSTISKIQDYVLKGGNAFITIIKFNHSYRVIYKREKAGNINVNKISFGDGETAFSPVFEAAATIAE